MLLCWSQCQTECFRRRELLRRVCERRSLWTRQPSHPSRWLLPSRAHQRSSWSEPHTHPGPLEAPVARAAGPPSATKPEQQCKVGRGVESCSATPSEEAVQAYTNPTPALSPAT